MDSDRRIDVFVSYSSADRERVRPLVEAMQDEGLHVWWDPRITPGAGFDAEIQEALDKARCVLVVWSEHSVTSEWVITEASEGLEKQILVPISIDDVKPPLAFRRRQTISIRDDRFANENVINSVRSVLEGGIAEIRQEKRGRRTLPIAYGAVFGLLVGAGITYISGVLTKTEEAPNKLYRMSIDLDGWADWKSVSLPVASAAISPNGNAIVYVARDDEGESSLMVRHLDRLDTVSIPGTDGATQPFFSPDGRSVGFIAGDLMKRVALDGGDPSIIASIGRESWGASWGGDDRIVFADRRSGLKSISVRGGEPTTVTELDSSRFEASHRLPHHLPNREAVLFSVLVEAQPRPKHETWLVDLVTGERTYLFDGIAPSYVSSGHIVYATAVLADRGSLWAVPFDLEGLRVTGSAKQIQGAVAGREGIAYAVPRSGPLLYMPDQGDLSGELVLIDTDGSTRTLAEGSRFEYPRFSQRGDRVAVGGALEQGRRSSIWIYDVETGASSRFAEGSVPLWSVSDDAITFTQYGTGLVTRGFDDSSSLEKVVEHPRFIFAQNWIDEGKALVYSAVNPETNADIYMLNSAKESRHILKEAGVPRISNDEKWIAFCTWPEGVFVGRFPNVGGLTEVAPSGCNPVWGNSDDLLYYQNFDKLWRVEISVASGVSLGARQMIADLEQPGANRFDLDRQGRIVFARHRYASPKPAVLLMNWEALLSDQP